MKRKLTPAMLEALDYLIAHQALTGRTVTQKGLEHRGYIRWDRGRFVLTSEGLIAWGEAKGYEAGCRLAKAVLDEISS